MSFHTRSIRKRPPVHPLRKLKRAIIWLREKDLGLGEKRRHYLWGALLVLVAIFVVLKVMLGVYGWLKNLDPADLFLSAGSELHQDEKGMTNLVLLGDGGSVRDGADLVDTIMVASLDHQNNAVTLLSIPRDYYVNSQYNSRINELYRNHKNLLGDERAFELFQEVVGKIVNLDIHYYLRVDFTAFVEAVDALGGIDVTVPVAIEDPFYPNPTDDGYDPFALAAGPQHLDGETALKYVRSRKTTSDYDRAGRQQLVLAAMREQALSKEVLTSSRILKELYGTLKKHLNTDMTLREMLSLAHFAKNFDRSRLINKVLHDDPARDGGFLYTPERELYGGQFVLLPYNDQVIGRYADLLFKKRQAYYDPLRLEVLNASKLSGIAGKLASTFTRFGFDVTNVDNLLDFAGERSFADKSVIRYYDWIADDDGNVIPKNPILIQALQMFLNTEAVPGDPSLKKGADISLILGADYETLAAD